MPWEGVELGKGEARWGRAWSRKTGRPALLRARAGPLDRIPSMWSPGDRVVHGLNRSLGAGRILEVRGRRLKVEFPDADEVLEIAAEGALAPLWFQSGSRARLGGEIVVVESCS